MRPTKPKPAAWSYKLIMKLFTTLNTCVSNFFTEGQYDMKAVWNLSRKIYIIINRLASLTKRVQVLGLMKNIGNQVSS